MGCNCKGKERAPLTYRSGPTVQRWYVGETQFKDRFKAEQVSVLTGVPVTKRVVPLEES